MKHHVHIMTAIVVVTMVLGITGCQMFDNSPTEVSAPAEGVNAASNFLMGTPELDDWGAYYNEGDTFIRLDIPIAGALKVEYSTTGGWSGAIFGVTNSPVGLEIGIVTRDGVTDVVEDVCVSYVENASFSSMPSNVEESTKEDWTHYKRLNDDGSTSDWWRTTADFEFSGDVTSACGVVNSEVQWDVIPGGAFTKPMVTWKLGAYGENCDTACAALGKTCQQKAFVTLNATSGLCRKLILEYVPEAAAYPESETAWEDGCRVQDKFGDFLYINEDRNPATTCAAYNHTRDGDRRLCPCS